MYCNGPGGNGKRANPLKALGKLLIVAIIVGVLTGVIVLRLLKLTEDRLARIAISPSGSKPEMRMSSNISQASSTPGRTQN
jgi:hypothetical protein